MSWTGRLALRYRRDGARTVAHDVHEGPLRVLQRLYPEGEDICHHVLVHPPGGVAGGDRLEVKAVLEPGTHAVVTTPGATRFYRSAGEAAVQQARLQLAGGARLEWLPLETLAYDGCEAENHLELHLEDGAQALGWDVLALGLPAANAPFLRGRFLQRLEWPGRWLERGRIDATDTALLDAPLGWDGQRVLATAWFTWAAAPTDTPAAGRVLTERLLEAARSAIEADRTPDSAAGRAGATSPQDGVVVVRALAARVEPAVRLLGAVRAAWREAAWGLQANPPRVWAT